MVVRSQSLDFLSLICSENILIELSDTKNFEKYTNFKPI